MRKSALFILCFLLVLVNRQLTAQAPPKPRDTTIQGPQTFAMIMGISKYKHIRPLTYADKDAEMFRDFLKSPAGGKLPDENIYCLLNEQALAANFFVQGFKWLKAKTLQKGDRLFIYLAGHGDAIDEDQFFYLAYDCNPAGDKNNYIVSGAIQMTNIKIKITKEVAKGVEVYLIMDACRSNELPGGSEGQSFFNQAVSETRAGEVIMLAAGAGQESLEDASIGNGHGLFTYYLVDGLSGLADTEQDNKITLQEIQRYVDKNVPSVAQDRFKRKQDPYFCCSEHSTKTISLVDSAYLQKWINSKKLSANTGTAFAPRSRGGLVGADTLLIETYNSFNDAVKENRLIGNNSAEFFYNQMQSKYPGDSYTNDAQATLAVEFINFAQSKINLYLECRDVSSIQRLRAQIDKEEEVDEITTSLNRMEKVAQQEFYEVGYMLEKAIEYIRPDDPEFAKSLMGRMYFFKARGYFANKNRVIDRSTAFQYAYNAFATDKNAAYILNTLSSLHLDNNRYDSAIYYAKKAIGVAPKWRYPYVTLAFAYKTLNKPDSAAKYYHRSIAVSPENADAYVDLGHFYYTTNQGDSAVKYYERALTMDPGNAFASNNLGWVNLARKNYEEAIQSFKRSIAANPRLVNSYNGLSKTFIELKQYDSARIYYSKAFSHYQDKSIVNVYIGNLFRDLKQYDSAKTYYRYAAMMDPEYEEAFNNLGQASFSLKQMDSAKYYYRRALQANPNSAFALVNLGKVFRAMKMTDSSYSYFQQAIRVEPSNPVILNNLGAIFGEDKNVDSAKSYFRRALFVRPDYKPASNNIIKIFRDNNQLDSITSFMKGVSMFEPGSTGFLNNIGLTFFDLKRYDSAKVYFRNALQKDPSNPQYYSNLALVFQQLKQYDSARYNIQRALDYDPTNVILWGNLSGVFKQLKEYDSASRYYRMQVLAKMKPGIPTYYALGNFYSDIKTYDSAVYYFKKVIALDPKHLASYNEIGTAFMEQEMYDSALHYFESALKVNPKTATALLNAGLASHSLQRYPRAIEYIESSIKIDGGKPKTFYQLACSYALSNNVEKAIENLKISYEQKGYKNLDNLINDPDLINLKTNKEFQALLDKFVPDWRER